MIAAEISDRLFERFLDPTDMVGSFGANETLAAVDRHAAEHGLRFPLGCDPGATLLEHVNAIEYAPASARFGPLADNILGLNWELRSGRRVRIGERVIKSTTGFDLLRFLLHCDGRYGRARDFVLRLRPRGNENLAVRVSGPPDGLAGARRAILRSSWVHWLDAVDLHVNRHRQWLAVSVCCGAGESAAFSAFFDGVSCEHGLAPAAAGDEVAGLPSLSLKATRATSETLARRLVAEHGGTARILCVNAVVHYFPETAAANARAGLRRGLLAELRTACLAEGGHLFGPWAPAEPPAPAELRWAETLERVWNRL